MENGLLGSTSKSKKNPTDLIFSPSGNSACKASSLSCCCEEKPPASVPVDVLLHSRPGGRTQPAASGAVGTAM